MGGDGGVIASNRKYLRGAGTADSTGDSQRHGPEPATVHAVCQELLTTCYLTKHPLHGNSTSSVSSSIVADPYGRLYLKEAAVEALLRRKNKQQQQQHGKEDALGTHIRGLKDLYDVHFQYNAGKPTCPVTGRELNGHHPALLIRSHHKHKGITTTTTTSVENSSSKCTINVISERVLKELGKEALQGEYGDLDNVLRLAPPPSMMEEIMETVRRDQEKSSSQKDKKRKGHNIGNPTTTTVTTADGAKVVKRLKATTQQRVNAAVQSNEILSSLFTDTTKQMSDKEKKDTLFARMG